MRDPCQDKSKVFPFHHVWYLELRNSVTYPITQGVHSIVKLNTMCDKTKSTFYVKHHPNGSKFYQFFSMSRYTWDLLHNKKFGKQVS